MARKKKARLIASKFWLATTTVLLGSLAAREAAAQAVAVDGSTNGAALADASTSSNAEPLLVEGVSLNGESTQSNQSGSNSAVGTGGANGTASGTTSSLSASTTGPSSAMSVDLNQPTLRPSGMINDSLEMALTGTRLSRAGLRFSLNVFGITGVGVGQNMFYEPLGPGGSPTTRFSFLATDLDLLIGARLTENIQALSEILFESEPESNSVIFDVERLEIRYRSGRHFVGLGRTHVDLGYWNNAYHHGYWLQPTINRPRSIRFEDQGGLIQAHAIGAVAGTGFALGGGAINISAGVSNGRGDLPGSVQVVTDNNIAKALTLKIESDGIGSPFLRFGLSGAVDWIAPASAAVRPVLPEQEIFQAMGNAFISYRGPALTVLSEAYLLQHSAQGQVWRSVAAFAVISYRFGIVSPYAAFDAMFVPGNDPFFHPTTMPTETPPLTRVIDPIVGLRLAFGNWNALKFEYRPTYIFDSSVLLHTFAAQWGFGI